MRVSRLELMAHETVRLKYQDHAPEALYPADSGRKLDVKVIFTDLRRTAVALTAARNLARTLSARITLMVTQVVPYPLPLADPPVSVEFTERLIESMTEGCDDADTTIEIYLCRDRCETVRRALPPDSVVIVGARKWPWWPSWERNLTRILRRDGCRVLVVTA
ncbi:MAG: hypothetical protein JWO19_1839 [Bryobacterales bacterium]|jgi:hypothetical protein|nr:hypothetical protein [Bryobacterales bacterium]